MKRVAHTHCGIRDRRAFAAFVRSLAGRASGMVNLSKVSGIPRDLLYDWVAGKRAGVAPDTVDRLARVARMYSKYGDGYLERLARCLRAPKSAPPKPRLPAIDLVALTPPARDWGASENVSFELARKDKAPIVIRGTVRVSAYVADLLEGKGFAGKVRRNADGTAVVSSDLSLRDLEEMPPERRARAEAMVMAQWRAVGETILAAYGGAPPKPKRPRREAAKRRQRRG